MKCNNISNAHNPKTIVDGDTALRIICTECRHQFTLRKDPFKGVPENREYSKIYKRDILQGKDNLFYKYYSYYMRT